MLSPASVYYVLFILNRSFEFFQGITDSFILDWNRLHLELLLCIIWITHFHLCNITRNINNIVIVVKFNRSDWSVHVHLHKGFVHNENAATIVWGFLFDCMYSGIDVFIRAIENSKLWYYAVPSSVWNRLLIGIVVCPLFTLNKIRIIINHGWPAWESVALRPTIYHILW